MMGIDLLRDAKLQEQGMKSGSCGTNVAMLLSRHKKNCSRQILLSQRKLYMLLEGCASTRSVKGIIDTDTKKHFLTNGHRKLW
jgi:hypothetical protein